MLPSRAALGVLNLIFSSPVLFILNIFLKVIIYPCLLHNPVRYMVDTYFAVNRKIFSGDGTMPDVMIAFSMAYKMTSVIMEYLAALFFILRHYATTVRRSILKSRRMSVSVGRPFSSRSSGAAILTRSINISSDASSSNMGISSLRAYHLDASSSHAKKMVYSFITSPNG